MIAIDRVQGLNVPGLCYLDVADVLDVESMPTADGGNYSDAVVLKPGKQWYRVNLALPGSRLKESWTLIDGSPMADMSISGAIGHDELAKLTALWSLPDTRFLVLAKTLNGDAILAGTQNEGCKGIVKQRDRGDESSPVNGYTIEFRVRRAEAAPYYLAELPSVADPSCPTLGQLLQSSSFAAVLSGLTSELYAAFEEYFASAGYSASLAEILAVISDADLLAALSEDQQEYIVDNAIDAIDGGNASTDYGDEVEGGGDEIPDDGGFNPDGFDPDDFITTQ
jgi:hypothetical protein